MTLPPGFRFKPTDEELVSYYLQKRVEGSPIEFRVIADVDLYRCEPWDLPHQSLIPSSNDLEWFFFSPRDRKYPHGTRTNRATESGYWKATGRDRTVKSKGRGIGMKKTLVFYIGRAPHGTRTDWLMHEYRLHESGPSDDLDAYVLCRVFKKTGIALTGDGPGNPADEKDEESTPPANSPQHMIPKPEPSPLQINGPGNTYMEEYSPLVTEPKEPIPGALGTQLFGNEDLPGAFSDIKFERSASDLESLMRLLEGASPPSPVDFLGTGWQSISLEVDSNTSERNEGRESEQSGGENQPPLWNQWDDSKGGLYMHNNTSSDLPLLVPDTPSPPPSSAPVSSSISARDKSFGPATVPGGVRVRSRLPPGVATHVDGPRPFPGPARQMVKFQVRSTLKKEQKTGVQDTPESVESEPKVAESYQEINHLESSEVTVNNPKDIEEALSRDSDSKTPPILSNHTEGSPATILEGPPSFRGEENGRGKGEGNDNKVDSPESDADDAEEGGLATSVERQQVPVKAATTMIRQQQEQRRLNLENRAVRRIGRVLGALLFQGKSSSVEFPCGVGSICLKAVPIKCSCEKGQDGREPRDCECHGNPNPAAGNVVAASGVVAPKVYPEKRLVEGEEQQQQYLFTRDGEGRTLQRKSTSEGSMKHSVGVYFMGMASAFLGLFLFPSAWRVTCQIMSDRGQFFAAVSNL